MQTLLTLLTIGSLLMLAMVVAGALVLRAVVRRMRRAIGSGLAVINRGAAEAADLHLATRAWLPGADRDVAQTRRRLARDVSATSRMVATGLRAGRPLEDLQHGLGQLAGEARALDVDLQVIAAEPDRAVRRDLLAERTQRADLIHLSCARVRAAVLAGGPGADDHSLRTIVDDLDEHAHAAWHRARAYRELSSLHGR